MKVLFVYADKEEEYNCSHWRSYLPSTYLSRFSNWDTDSVPLQELGANQTIVKLEWADIILVERVMSNQIWNILEYWRARGKKVIFDMDDSYKNIPIGHGAYDFWINGNTYQGNRIVPMPYPPIVQIEWFSKLVDAVSSPSKLILEDWKDYNDNRIWLPNFVDQDLYEPIPFREEGKVVIGWGGGASHYLSWYDSGLITAFRRVYEKYKTKIELKLITGDEQLALKLKEFKPTRIRTDRLKYPEEIQAFDIALAPLAGQYDRRRSWLKIAEYAATGIPWIATDSDQYHEFNFPGSILVPNKPAAWEDAMIKMIEDRLSYYKQAKESYPEWMKHFSIQNNHQFLADQFMKVMDA